MHGVSFQFSGNSIQRKKRIKKKKKKKKKVGIETVPQPGTKVTECIAISECLAF